MRGMPADNVILVGFMGAGKSSVGRLLARRLGRSFVETDDMIVAREGKPIPEIFREHGEARFRELEAEALQALRLKSGDVIANRGGVVGRAGGFAAPHARAGRTGGRPMLAGRAPAELEELYRTRQAYYRRAH